MGGSKTTGGGPALTAIDVDRACASCVLWGGRLDPDAPVAAKCFRYPPTSPEGHRDYPITARTDWCGGHIRAAEDTRGFARIGERP